jgi:hypothetical protein
MVTCETSDSVHVTAELATRENKHRSAVLWCSKVAINVVTVLKL